jgi:hypothetical protein
LEGKAIINPYESKVFWVALIVAPLVWVIFDIVSLFRLEFSRLALTMLGSVLACSNLIGYVKCARGMFDD